MIDIGNWKFNKTHFRDVKTKKRFLIKVFFKSCTLTLLCLYVPYFTAIWVQYTGQSNWAASWILVELLCHRVASEQVWYMHYLGKFHIKSVRKPHIRACCLLSAVAHVWSMSSVATIHYIGEFSLRFVGTLDNYLALDLALISPNLSVPFHNDVTVANSLSLANIINLRPV